MRLPVPANPTICNYGRPTGRTKADAGTTAHKGSWHRVSRQAGHTGSGTFPVRCPYPVAPSKDVPELNNNNRGNNRRRGRGNNRPQGGGQQLNRIDSRARGNAPQLLEKYRKLAQDAHLNGDRVQAEYYLQFADHYFRVIADTRLRQEEQRQRSSERWQDQEPEGEDAGDFEIAGDFPTFQPVPPVRQRDDRRDDRRDEREPREGRGERDYREGREPREHREPRENREPREQREYRERPRRDRDQAEPVAASELQPGLEGEPVSVSASDNPFVRDARPGRGLRPRGERRPRHSDAGEGQAGERGSEQLGLDPPSLPPSIGVRVEAEPAVEAAPVEAGAEAPAPRKRGRPRKNPLPETDVPAAVDG